MRKELYALLGHVVSARLAVEALKLDIVMEMQSGYRPTYRGHEWSQEQFEALERASSAIEDSFQYLKYLQFPERGIYSPLKGGHNDLRADESQTGSTAFSNPTPRRVGR